MIQSIHLQRRLPVLVLLIVALAVLVSLSLARMTMGASASSTVATPSVVVTEPVLAQRALIQAAGDKNNCDSGAYVSGDLAGDRSPAEIYATMCGKP